MIFIGDTLVCAFDNLLFAYLTDQAIRAQRMYAQGAAE